MSQTPPMYPLLFDPIYKEKVWGGRSLERIGRELPGNQDTPIGESWELVDLATTSASGGGGGAEHSVISNGSLAGTRIDALITNDRAAVLGEIGGGDGSDGAGDEDSSSNSSGGGGGGFPLLIKYLDASDNLSVQVHPSPEYAAAHPGAHLKSEAWYVVDCAPGAVIYKGLKPGVTADQLRAALATNTDAAVVPLLHTVPVKPGDCHYLPSGTCHALGAGVLVAEVQTPSDTTFRVYDWGRTGRVLHVDQAIACVDFDDPATDGPNAWEHRDTHDEPGGTRTRLVNCPFFEIEHIAAEPGHAKTWRPHQPEIWMVLDGGVQVGPRDGELLTIAQGQTTLLTPGIGPVLATTTEPASWLRITIPQPA